MAGEAGVNISGHWEESGVEAMRQGQGDGALDNIQRRTRAGKGTPRFPRGSSFEQTGVRYGSKQRKVINSLWIEAAEKELIQVVFVLDLD